VIVSLWLPFPPSVNNLFPTSQKTGLRYPSKQYKQWQQAAEIYVTEQKPHRFIQPVDLKIELFPRDLRPRDVDNYNKAIIDLLVKCHIVPGDDSRFIKGLDVRWRNPAKNAGARVAIQHTQSTDRPALNAAERHLLERVQRAGCLGVKAGSDPGGLFAGLVEKGYLRPVEGLLKDAPQGYTLLEPN